MVDICMAGIGGERSRCLSVTRQVSRGSEKSGLRFSRESGYDEVEVDNRMAENVSKTWQAMRMA